MKKFLLSLLLAFISFSSYSQLNEGFENTVGPNALPSTVWTLGSGNWAVFDNGFGTVQRWNFLNFVTNPPIVNSGTNGAYLNRETIGQGNTSEDYLVSPLVTVPSSGELRFFIRTGTAGDQGSIFSVKIGAATASQTNAPDFSLLQSWTETTLNTAYNLYEEKVINLATYAGQQVYIMFDVTSAQPTGANAGDRFYMDDVRVIQNCGTAAPTASASQIFCSTSTVSNLTATGSNIQWYSSSLGGTPLAPSTALTNATYYATQTVGGCESLTRTPVFVTANSTPTNLTTSNIGINSLTLNWNITGASTSWQILALPCGTTAPTATATGWSTANGNSFVVNGLNAYTCYDLYVRSVCSSNIYSDWAGPTTATTLVGAAVCGGNYVDTGGANGNYTSNSNSITSLCPTTAGFVTTVTFLSFNTEANNDGIYVFNGNSIAAPPILSTNGVGSATLNTPGAFWGNTIPGPFTSTSTDGCLTFQFKSNNNTNRSGWVANIVCAPPTPTASSPQVFCNTATVSNLTASGLTGSTFNWYTTAIGGSALTTTDVITSGTYYVSQVNTGTESLTRATVTVVVNQTPAPTVADQSFCNTTVTVSNLVANGTAIQWYTTATGGTALASNTTITSGTYYVTQTLNNCENVRTAVQITVTTTPIATASAQTFCNSAAVSNLVATGSNPKWYLTAIGGNALAATAAVFTGTYYVTQTIAGCESPSRTAVNITVNAIPQPTTSAQTFCNSALVSNLVATGTAIKWYSVATGGTALVPTASLTTGTYYVTQTLLGCESPRLAVAITVNSPVPTANSQNFICVAGTIANLVATGSNIKWYNVSTGGTALATTTALATGTYYVTQTISGCESPRLPVTVTISQLPNAPTAVAQTLCGGSTIANLSATGTGIKWYTTPTGGTALASSTVLTSGTYYATQTINTCESTSRTAVSVIINTTPQPSALAQTFCNTATISNLVVTGTAIKWYSAATGGTALVATTLLASGTYYVTQTLNACESTRLSVAITVNSPLPTVSDQTFCNSATVNDLIATGTNIKWYSVATGGSALGATSALTSATYYVTQTISGCESPRAAVLVTINVIAAPVATSQVFCNNATVADLVATGSSIKWYSNAIGGVALTSATTLTNGTYYASQTLNGCESSIRTAVDIVIQVTPTPTATSLSFCSSVTVNDLTATGNNLLWYANATGGTALTTTSNVTTGTYYVSQTINGCESPIRTAVLVTVTNTTPNNLTTSNIGTNTLTLNWNIVGAASSWHVLALPCGSTPPTSNSTGWVATNSNSFTVTGLFAYTCYDLYVRSVCSSGTTFSAWSGPTTATTLVGSAICGGNYVDAGGTGNQGGGNYPNNANSITSICPTVAGFVTTVTFTSFNTEANNDGIYVFNGNSIAATPILSTNGVGSATLSTPGAFWGTTIPGPFTSTSPDGCLTFQFKSNNFISRSGWIANIVCAPPTPTATSPQVFCNSAIVSNLTATGLTGSTFNWYTTATGGTALTSTDILTSGTYYVSQVNSGTESLTRATVTVVINQTQAPAVADQSFCNTTVTIANLVATGTTIQWYSAATGGTALASNATVTTGTYYVTQTLNNCESPRTAAQITVTNTPTATANAQTFCNSATISNLVATGSNLKWYLTATGGTALTPTDAVFTGTYYVTQTIAGCESPTRTGVNITVNAIPQPTASAQTFCNSATVSNLVATGTAIKWYSVATGGTALAPTAALTTGTYYVTQTLLGCESATRTAVSVTLNTTTAPTASAQIFCAGATVSNLVATGTAIKWYAAVTGGIALTRTATLATGTYYASQTINSCESTRTAVVVTVTIPTVPAFTQVAAVCSGVSLLALPITSNNTITGTWSPALNNTATTTYTFTPTTGQCAVPATMTITVNTTAAPAASAQTFCAGATVSNLVATGTAIKWYAAATGGIALTGTATLATGTYYASQTINSCESTRTAVVVTVTIPTVPAFTQVAAVCSGATLAALPTTSNNTITGTWSPALNNTATTTYTFTPTTGQCAVPATMTISVTPKTTPTFTQVAAICSGSTIAALPSTSINSVTGTWSPAINNTATTTYTFTPTAGLCANTATMTITVNPLPTATFSAQNPTICSGTTGILLFSGTIGDVVTYNDGTTNQNVTITASPTAVITASLTANTTYTLVSIIRPSTTCSQNLAGSVTIAVNPLTVIGTPALGNTVCAGTAVTFSVVATGTLPLSYQWYFNTISNPIGVATSTSYTITSPSVANTGDYFCVVTGTCSTATSNIAILTVNPIVTPTFTQVAAVCSGATIAALPTTSTNAVTGTWSPAINNLATTTYTFTPTAGLCANTATMTITVTPKTTPTFTQVAAVCSGATISALPTTSTNAVTGTWSPTLNNLATTTYTFTPTDAVCNNGTTMTITVNPKTTPTFTQVAAVCSGATISALPTTSTNAVTGTWSPAVNNTATTTYTFTPTDAVCNTIATMTITVNPNSTPAFTQVAAVCSGASITALPTTSTNAITGTWSPAINNLATTTYTFTPTAGLCSNTTTMTITVNPATTPTFTQVAAVCSGASLSALPTTSTNAVTGTWSPAVNNTATTTYTFTPTAGLCANTATMTITVTPKTSPTFTQVAAVCSGATIAALPTTSINAVTGTWSPTLNNLATTTYTFTPTDAVCNNVTTMTITVTPKTTPTFTQVAAVCSGATFSALPTTSTNAVTGTWSPAVNNTATTTYTFTPTDAVCNTIATMTITVNPNSTPVFTQVAAVCSGATIAALPTTSTNAVTGTWSPAINNLATTTYTFTPTAGLCANTATMTITVNPNVTPAFTQVSPICSGATITALPTTSTNAFTGTWSPAINNLATTTYTFTPTAGLCANIGTMTITVNPNVTPAFTQVSPICSGASLLALPTTSTNNITGTWSPAINNLATTTYTFTPTTGQCAVATTMTIIVNTNETPTFTQVSAICSGASLLALPTTSTNSITGTWSPALNNNATTTYTFTPTTGQCAVATTMTIIVNTNETPTFTLVSAICSGASLSALPTISTNSITGTWSPALNNTATTTYTFTPTTGQCATTAPMTITVNPNVTPTFTQVSAICSGATLATLPTTSTNSITGTWSPALNNTATTTYTFTPTTGQCNTTAIMIIAVNTNSNTLPVFSTVDPICSGASLSVLPTTSNNSITGTWSPAINNTVTTTYIFAPDSGQCATTTTLEIVVNQHPVMPPLACYESATFNTATCTWDVTGTQPAQPTLACYESATFNTTTCTWDVTGTQPAQPTLACYESATFNTTTCIWDVTGTQPAQPTLACYESATFNTATCTWDVTGTQPVQPTLACYESAIFNTTTCTWDVTGTQPAQPTLACYESATFNTTTCTWDVTGTQPLQPTLACYESATFNTATCTWDVTGTQPVQPTLACYESAIFNTTTCTWDVTGTQPLQPTLACYESATFNTTTCTWDVTGTQPAQPTLACYESATFNTATCAWDVTGTQPVQPTLACYESATFNTTSCTWDVTGTQPVQPTLACYESATFNTATCTWDVTGTQPVQPTLACYESATFNAATCTWDVTGTQPAQPTLACYESATFNTTSCTWDVTGTAPAIPTGNSTQTFTVAALTDATIANLVVSPNNVIWYSTMADAMAGTNPLVGTTLLSNGATYYAVNGIGACFSAPFAVTVTVNLGTDSFDSISFNYYPNPTSGILNISYSKEISQINVVNLVGQTVLNKSINATDVQIDLSSLANATYFVKVVSEGKTKIFKVVKGL